MMLFTFHLHISTFLEAQLPEEKEALLVTEEYQEQMSESTFLFLTLDLPTAPLYKDEKEQLIIPQVPLFNILAKFNGNTEKVHDQSHAKLKDLIINCINVPMKVVLLMRNVFCINNVAHNTSCFPTGVQNLQGEFSQKVSADQTSSLPRFLH